MLFHCEENKISLPSLNSYSHSLFTEKQQNPVLRGFTEVPLALSFGRNSCPLGGIPLFCGPIWQHLPACLVMLTSEMQAPPSPHSVLVVRAGRRNERAPRQHSVLRVGMVAVRVTVKQALPIMKCVPVIAHFSSKQMEGLCARLLS